MNPLKGTKTAENLMKAFAGESQARSRYTFYSSIARNEGYIEIANLFDEISNQEKEHGKRFYKFLKEDLLGETVKITAEFPVGLYSSTLDNLRAAASGENEEWTDLYPEFAKVAKKEGFYRIGEVFLEIASVEKFHEERFNKFEKRIRDDKVFKSDIKELWQCQNCGYIYEGMSAPKICPACEHPQGYFKRLKDC